MKQKNCQNRIEIDLQSFEINFFGLYQTICTKLIAISFFSQRVVARYVSPYLWSVIASLIIQLLLAIITLLSGLPKKLSYFKNHK